jgi:hypothetical protein
LPGDAVHVAGWGEAHGAAVTRLKHINTIRLQSMPTTYVASYHINRIAAAGFVLLLGL